MHLVIIAFALIGFFLVAHVVFWRFYPRLRSISTLVVISTGVLAVGIGIGAAVQVWNTIWDVLLVAQFHIFVTFAYIIGYSGVEQESPSLVILKLASQASGGGVDESDIKGLINDDFFLKQRLAPIISSGMIERQGKMLILTKKGRLLAYIFHIFRKSAGAQVGA